MSLLQIITSSGVAYAESKSEKRNILLTNYISLIATLGPILLAGGRFLLSVQDNARVAVWMVLSIPFFLLPIILNRAGLIYASRIVLCWTPSVVVFVIVISSVRTVSHDATAFVGTRFLLLASSCFPFLVFNLRSPFLFIVALLVPTLSLLLYDPILNLFDAGYLQQGYSDTTYSFNNVRVFVSFLITGLSFYFLRRIIEKGEERNEQLLVELAEKNEEILQQASNEVNQLNQQLYVRLQQLSEREFILNQSQRIAKIGSWEYTINGGKIFWSDEMFNIFGVGRNIDLKTGNLGEIIGEKEAAILIDSTISLLRTGQPYDLTLRTKTPMGQTKWFRLNAFPVKEGTNVLGARGICHDITFYKESEELLRASDKKYRSLFEQASDPIMITDFNGQLTDVNTSLCTMFGYTREELLQSNISALIDPEQLRTNPIRFDLLATGVQAFNERRMIRKDGTLVQVEANVKKFEENAIMAIVRDVTELRKAQRQIQISEAKFRGAFEYSAIGMALVSLEGRWLQVNRELCHMLGYTEAELLTVTYQDVTHPEDITKDFDLFEKAIRGEIETYGLEKRYIHKDKSVIWVHLNVSIIKDNQGKSLYCVSQIEDITVEKRAHEELLLSQANLRATINNTEILIWSVDRDFKLLTFNRPFYNYMKTRYGVEIQTGSRMEDPNPAPENIERLRMWEDRYRRALLGESISLEQTRFGMDLQYSLSPIVEGDQIIGVSIFADNVTKRKAHDRALSEANKKIDELKLMALRAVMNPHFVFNVLNSIQFFIAKNDRLNAINYLSTFSKLIRGILTHSVSNKIKLDDEIEMLRNYVKLEMTRFENKFDFVLNVDPGVDSEVIEIPSLLIQPYVENAILHGLYNKKEKGKLSIDIRQQGEALLFEIEDDGVGREVAIKLRQQNFPGHKSMGIRLTEERLKLIKSQNHAAFEIDDLVNENGPCGTRVRIWIPF